MLKIKICGISNLEDALLAADLGANALGFIFASSPRQISKNTVSQITKRLPPFVTRVGVFVNESSKIVNETAFECGLDVVQLHGEESPEYCAQMLCRVIKSLRISENQKIDELNLQLIKYEPFVSAFLFDTYSPEKHGGTGKTFDWSILQNISTHRPIIISGGLTPENIPELLKMFSPYAIDVNSGVESSPGKKDSEKLKSIIKLSNT